MENARISLLIIDPQNDFCDIPERERPLLESGMRLSPALPVSGADGDMKRLAAFIERAGDRLCDIHVTLDSHNPVDIAHPSWWRDAAGAAPAPFTVIGAAAVRSGAWRASDPARQARSLAYVEALERNGRYALVVWPEHCLIGHWGHNLHSAVADALDAWAHKRLETVDFVFKGANPYTEHYSAVRAEVPDPGDPGTLTNETLIGKLAAADTILIAGEALSHCVANTVRDIADSLGPQNIAKMVLLTDCTSSVSGFEQLGENFLREMTARGMRVATSTDHM